MVTNDNCDGGHCTSNKGIIRVMPLGGGGNLLLCFACFAHENRYRHQRGVETGNPEAWPTVSWNTAKIYHTEDRA